MSFTCLDTLRPVVRTPQSTVSVHNLSDWQLTLDYLPGAEAEPGFWLRRTTLDFLRAHPQGMETHAILLRHTPTDREIVLTAQTFYFLSGKQVSATAKGETSRWDFRRRLIARFAVKTLVLGQLLTSGDVAQRGLAQLPSAEAARLLPAVADTVLKSRRGYQAVLLKDLFTSDDPAVARLQARGFTPLPADPVMNMDLQPWATPDDYLASLSSKYRVRYRRARSHGAGVARRRLTIEDEGLVDQLFSLYTETSSGATFNVTALTPAYFRWLLEAGEVEGYFAEGELVGFTTAIANGNRYQAHYLGLREAYKRSHHLYHNMLFDLLEAALNGGYATIDFGRTALEIKSSLGAEPYHYANLLRVRNGLINGLVPRFVQAVFAAAEWQPRSPFRLH